MIKIKDFVLGFDFKSLVILGLVILLLLTRMCASGDTTPTHTMKVDGKKYEVLKHTVDTVYVDNSTIEYKPGNIIYREAKVQGIIPADVDKDSITKDYYSTTVYKDTLKLKNKQGYIAVTDTISQNKVIGRIWDAHVTSSIIHDKTIVKELPKTQLYLGGVMGFDNKNLTNFAGPSFLLKSKKDHIYSLGVGYGTNQVLSLQVGMYWKLKLGK